MNMSDTITRNVNMRSGAPCLAGTRSTVGDVVLWLYYEKLTLEEANHQAKKYFPARTESNIKECLIYCSNRKCMLGGFQEFCEGCTLDKYPLEEGDEEPEDVWLSASTLLEKLEFKKS